MEGGKVHHILQGSTPPIICTHSERHSEGDGCLWKSASVSFCRAKKLLCNSATASNGSYRFECVCRVWCQSKKNKQKKEECVFILPASSLLIIPLGCVVLCCVRGKVSQSCCCCGRTLVQNHHKTDKKAVVWRDDVIGSWKKCFKKSTPCSPGHLEGTLG